MNTDNLLLWRKLCCRHKKPPLPRAWYYEHDCSISVSEDVLELEIRGRTVGARLRRWWHNLFLLDVYDERCSKYYHSSNALRLDRLRHFHRYRGRIHPLSKFTGYWNGLILVTSLLDRLLMYRVSTVFCPAIPMPYPAIGVLFEFILLFDILINFLTGYIDHKQRTIVLDTKIGCVHYCSTKFFLHVLSSLPLQTMLWIRYGKDMNCKPCKSNSTVSCMKLLGMFGYYRVVDATRIWQRERRHLCKSHCLRFCRIVTLAALARMQLLSLVDAINVLVMIWTKELDDTTYMALVLSAQMVLPPALFLTFELALLFRPFFILKLRGDVTFRFIDQMLTMVSIVVFVVFFTWILLEFFKLIHWLIFPADELAKQKNMMLSLLRSYQVPTTMANKVLAYYSSKAGRSLVIERSNVLCQTLPPALKDVIHLALNEHYVRKVSYFSEWPVELVQKITLASKDEIYMAGDIVTDLEERGEGLMMLKAGVMAVYSNERRETGHLIDGDAFGEVSLITNRDLSVSAVVAVTQCTVLILTKEVFRKIMRHYPTLFYEMRAQVLELDGARRDSRNEDEEYDKRRRGGIRPSGSADRSAADDASAKGASFDRRLISDHESASDARGRTRSSDGRDSAVDASGRSRKVDQDHDSAVDARDRRRRSADQGRDHDTEVDASGRTRSGDHRHTAGDAGEHDAGKRTSDRDHDN